MLRTKGQGGVVAVKSISHHHHQSTWQGTELRLVYGNTRMTETDWARGVYRDTGVAEMDGVTGGIYSGDPGVDSLHRILDLISLSYYTTNYTLHLSHLLILLAVSETLCGSAQFHGASPPGTIIPCHHLPTHLEPEPLILRSCFWNAVRGAAES